MQHGGDLAFVGEKRRFKRIADHMKGKLTIKVGMTGPGDEEIFRALTTGASSGQARA